MTNDIDEDILRRTTTLVRALSRQPQAVPSDPLENLFSAGVLDSIMLVGLVSRLEGEFGIRIPPNEYLPENFTTLGGLARMATRLASTTDT